ncbi:MAG TPA: F0F1 ATP synthase subunit delta [Dehalococcoidia bacterium]|nr:F0F1 ATP synthase subunit delta [Dehalococcoidia bacterium]
MIREIAAKRYAEGIFELARSQNKLDEWSASLQTIAGVLSDAQVMGLLQSSRMSHSDKLSLVERLFQGMDEQPLNLVRLLVSKGRTRLAPQIAEAYQEMVDETKGIVHATVTTAVPLSDEERDMVTRKLQELSDKEVILQTEVDENIIGGLVARMGDTLIDGSTRSKLATLKQQLEGSRA